MDLCGSTCQQAKDSGAPCSMTWKRGCNGHSPPAGFTVQSILFELCPNECQDSNI